MDEDIVMAETMAEAFPSDPSPDAYVSPDEAARRINPAIDPDSHAWKTQHQRFNKLLHSIDHTIQSILLKNFTWHEARMLVAADRHDLNALQQRNTQRYNALLAGRFKDIKNDLVTKMTMLYFGLPVEPMLMPLDELVKEIETREPEGQRWTVDPPLHFLTAHSHRNWGKDALIAREAPTWPLPFATPQVSDSDPGTLRGGAAPELTLRGGAAPVERRSEDDITIGTHQGIHMYLHGYQGRIPFDTQDKWSFAETAQALLSYHSDVVNIENARYSIHVFDRKTKKITYSWKDSFPATGSNVFLQNFSKKFGPPLSEDYGKDQAVFITRDGDPLPTSWEPQPEQFKLDLVQLVYEHAPGLGYRVLRNYAYLAFPKTKKASFDIADFAANQYNPHLRVATEVLTTRPVDSCRQLFVSWNSSKPTRDRRHMVYGGLGERQTTWNSLHPLNTRGAEWQMKRKNLLENQLALVLPNYYPSTSDERLTLRVPSFSIRVPEVDYESLIQEVVADAFDTDVNHLDHLLLFPGHLVLGMGPKSPLPMGFEIAARAGEPRRQEATLKQLFWEFADNSSAEPYAFLHPVWKSNASLLYAGWQDEGSSHRLSIPMPSIETPLDEFRKSIVEFSKALGALSHTYNPKEHYLIITPTNKRDEATVWDYPTQVVEPGTTPDEWFRIRMNITSRENVVNIVAKKYIDWRSKIPKSNVWGPRYGLARPSALRSSVTFDESTVREDSERPKQPIPKTPATESFKKGVPTPPPDRPAQKSQTAKTDRERDWTEQPSIFPYRKAPRIPINAPPQEHILRTTSSVPMVSKAISTPTEVARLQKDLWDLRNIILARTAHCPYKDCKFVHRLDDRVAIEQHVEYEHMAKQCMWCEEPMYNWWSEEQKKRHLKDKHHEQLWKALIGNKSYSGKTPWLIPPPEARRGASKNVQKGVRNEETWLNHCHPPDLTSGNPAAHYDEIVEFYKPPRKSTPYCDRCGLQYPFNEVELKWHDHVCISGNQPDKDYRGLCTQCRRGVDDGELDHEDLEDEADIPKHGCRFCWEDPGHCVNCDIDLNIMPSWYRKIHEKSCKGYGTKNWEFCEWCGASVDELADPKSDKVYSHREFCERYRVWFPDRSRPRNADNVKVDVLVDYTQEILHYSTNEDEVPGGKRRSTRKRTRASPKPVQVEEVEDEDEEMQVEEVEDEGEDEDEEMQESIETPIDYVSEVSSDEDEAPARNTRGRTRSPRPSIETARMASPEDSSSEQDDDVPNRRRRSPSPDWDAQLGPGESDFEPDEDMYCSKCLRKAPKHRDRSPGRSPLGREREMEYHTDPERCCRIRNGIGHADNLPNRSGWIPMADLPKRIGQVKQKFLKKYPGYDQVLYPTNKSDQYSSLWRSDPNNETNKAFWDIPWPPYEGSPPFPGEWEHPEIPSYPSGKKRNRMVKLKLPHDPAYRYQSDEDSADELEPDVDDLVEVTKVVVNDEAKKKQGEEAKKRQREEEDEKEKGRKVKKARTTPTPEEGKKKKGTPAPEEKGKKTRSTPAPEERRKSARTTPVLEEKGKKTAPEEGGKRKRGKGGAK